jgi:hypothetical protein
MREPTFDFGTESYYPPSDGTLFADRCPRSAPLAGGTRGFGLGGREGANGDRVRPLDAVVLDDHGGTRLACVVLAA